MSTVAPLPQEESATEYLNTMKVSFFLTCKFKVVIMTTS